MGNFRSTDILIGVGKLSVVMGWGTFDFTPDILYVIGRQRKLDVAKSRVDERNHDADDEGEG